MRAAPLLCASLVLAGACTNAPSPAQPKGPPNNSIVLAPEASAVNADVGADGDPGEVTAATRGVPGPAQLTWHGGQILASPKLWNIYWGSAWSAGDPNARMLQYEAFVQAMDGNTDFVAPLAQYGVGPLQYLGQSFTIAIGEPTGEESDDRIRQLLLSLLSSGALDKPDANTLYQVFLPPGIGLVRNGKDHMCTKFCAYHASFDNPVASVPIRYVALPSPDCGPCAYVVGLVDRETVIDAHEISEAATDVDVNNHRLGWYDDRKGEIGDICAGGQIGDVAGFKVQSEWSNVDGACVPPHSPTPDFALAFAPPAATVEQGASGSALLYAYALNGWTPTTLTLSFGNVPAGITPSLSTTSLDPQTSASVSFEIDSGVDPGSYPLEASASDGTLMHTVALTVNVVAPQPVQTLLFDGAENGIGEWQITTTSGSSWSIETTSDARTGNARWRTNAGEATYADSTATFLVSPEVDLSSAGSATLIFADEFQLEDGYDFFSVWATADNGTTWTTLASHTGTSEGFPGWAPVVEALDLAAFVGRPSVRVAFALNADASNDLWGVALDDIEIDAR
jgi:hypothetical protein